MSTSTGSSNSAYDHLRAAALRFPEAVEEFPWGHSAIKVRGKAFVFMGGEKGKFGLSCKLPHSHEAALLLPFATPTGYGLGKSGWVSANFDEGDQRVPVALLEEWIGESYRAVAPKKLAATLEQAGAKSGAPGRSEGTGVKKAAKAGASGRSEETGVKKAAVRRAAKAGDSGRSEGAGTKKKAVKKAAKAGAAGRPEEAGATKAAGKKAAKAGASGRSVGAGAKKTAKAGASGRSAGTGATKSGKKAVSGRRAG